MKKICYLLLILSYILVILNLVYYNVINPNANDDIGKLVVFIVLPIWLIVPLVIERSKSVDKNSEEDKVEKWLRRLASAPAYLLVTVIALIPALIINAIYLLIFNTFVYNMKKKCKPLLNKGFTLTKKRQQKKTIYLLKKDTVVFRIHEFDIYEISIDSGASFVPLINSTIISYDDKKEIEAIMCKYETCDIRDKDLYEPTDKIIKVIDKYII